MRFNREVLEVDEAEDHVQLTMFKAGLRSKEFVVALAKSLLVDRFAYKSSKVHENGGHFGSNKGRWTSNIQGRPSGRPKRAKKGKKRSFVQQ